MSERIVSLKMENITKRFPGVLASDNISIEVNEGEVLALVGENGAGKTTLMNILMGIYEADEGRILINGEPVHFRGPEDAFKAGLGMVHQMYMLVDNMTVLENVALGYKKAWKKGRLDLGMVRSRIEEVSRRYQLQVNPDAYIWQLSVGEQQRVELVKTLSLGAKFLILDEPTSALTPQETDELIELLKNMRKELSIIFISHKLQEVKALSDKVAILRHGKIVFTGNTGDYSSQEIAQMMTGHEIDLPKNEEESGKGELALSIKNLRVKSDMDFYAVDGLDLDIHSGEIMGLAGVSGNGQRELAEAINGIRKAESGEIRFFGKNIVNLTPGSVIRQGMGYIPEERNIEGIVPSFSIKENLILKDAETEKFSHRKFLKKKKIEENAEKLIRDFDIRCPSSQTAAGSLSGGNIQKVILSRELTRNARFLIAVYPTRGLDLGAVEFIHKELLKMKKENIGILLISEELEEIINLSDRIAVIYKGKIQKVMDKKEASVKALGILMAGVGND
ncbi:MAG TPA: ABC transporter ATP-binding protein [Candidatus Ornithospirochaeta avicola]|uniref:ABC transporter ATP-binding protein n=1 Tax=Candidatus Ornithospirochaeta avicola TaxID=2840896 RepID=A0A9D1PUJ8_9SPIO|nr:ABC transporter ATP-binding protein [Candidatus Ornithospirochaeta avicola]